MKMRKQRLMGLALVVIAALVVLIASTGETPEDRDATAALLIGPLGLYMIFTKKYVLYDGEPEAKARDEPELSYAEKRRLADKFDPWAPPEPSGQSSPLYPFDTPIIPTTTEGVRTWQGTES